MDIIIFRNVQSDSENQIAETIRTLFEETAKEDKRQRRIKSNKDAYEKKRKTSLNVTENIKEEREEEREDSSPSSPSSLSSSPSDSPINYPITPIIPSSQEKEEEKEKPLLTAPVQKIETIQTFGIADNVKLTPSEYQKLTQKLGYERAIDLIEALSIYMAQNPKNENKYKNHYFTILNWDRRDKKENNFPVKNYPPEEDFLDGIDWEGKYE